MALIDPVNVKFLTILKWNYFIYNHILILYIRVFGIQLFTHCLLLCKNFKPSLIWWRNFLSVNIAFHYNLCTCKNWHMLWLKCFFVIVDLQNVVLSWHILCCLNTYNVKKEITLNKNWILRLIIICIYLMCTFSNVWKNLMSLILKSKAFNEGTLLYLCMDMKPLISMYWMLNAIWFCILLAHSFRRN